MDHIGLWTIAVPGWRYGTIRNRSEPNKHLVFLQGFFFLHYFHYLIRREERRKMVRIDVGEPDKGNATSIPLSLKIEVREWWSNYSHNNLLGRQTPRSIAFKRAWNPTFLPKRGGFDLVQLREACWMRTTLLLKLNYPYNVMYLKPGVSK